MERVNCATHPEFDEWQRMLAQWLNTTHEFEAHSFMSDDQMQLMLSAQSCTQILAALYGYQQDLEESSSSAVASD